MRRSTTIPGIASSLAVSSLKYLQKQINICQKIIKYFYLGVLHDISGSIVSSDGSGVRGGVAASGAGSGSGGGLSFGGDLLVQAVQTLGLSAVEVEPPVADEVVLVEEGSVGTEEAVLGQTYNI